MCCDNDFPKKYEIKKDIKNEKYIISDEVFHEICKGLNKDYEDKIYTSGYILEDDFK